MTGMFIPVKNEEVGVGDSVFLTKSLEGKNVDIEAAVIKRIGRRVRLLPEDRSISELWVAPEELSKVVKGGAEELMSRAAREAEKKARAEALRKAEEDRQAAEKAEKDGYNQAQKEREARIQDELNRRAVPSRDWLPVGKYNWIESPVLMDQTKDVYRIIWYEIDVDKDYGGKHDAPQIDLSEVEELKEAVVERNKEREAAAKEAAKKKKGKPKKKTDDELAAEEAAKEKEEQEDQAKQDQVRKRAELKHEAAMAAYDNAEKSRTPVKPPKYPPDLPPTLEPPQHPANQKLYEQLLLQGHAGDRIFYTDGSMHNNPFVAGSKDGVLRGGGLLKEVAEALGFQEKIVSFTEEYDGGITLKKHDCFPPEDPASWVYKDEDKWYGEFREDQEGMGTEEW